MKDKTILWVICFVLLAAFVSSLFTLTLNYQWGTFALYAGAAGRLLGLVILIRTGQFIKAGLLKLALLFVSIVFIGSLFKIMHWPGSGAFLLTGFAGIPVIYAIHFSKKSKKGLTDFLKLIWVVLIFTTSALIIFHWPGQEPVKLLESFIFCLLFWNYTFTQQKKEDAGFQWLEDRE